MKTSYFLGIICFLASAAGAYASDSLFSQAQKLYSQGNFESAAKIYSGLCPQMTKEKKACQLMEIKALMGIGKAETLAGADEKLLAILSQIEPNDSLYAEFNAENAKLQIMLGQPARAIRSWNAAQTSANTDYFSELFVLCQDIISAYPENTLKKEECNKIKPADTSLISLPRKKITPLANAKLAANTQPAASSQSTKWYAQLGAFSEKDNAEKLVLEFKQKGTQLYIVEVKSTDKKFFAVRTGNFPTRAEAENFAEQNIAPSHKDYRIFFQN